MPRICGVSLCSTVCCMRLMPSARSVCAWSKRRFEELLTWVILSLSDIGPPAHAQQLLDGHATRLCDVGGAAEIAQAVDGRLRDVVRVRRAERLRQHVVHAGRLENRAHGAAGDDAGAA